jgi:hypothetical protein
VVLLQLVVVMVIASSSGVPDEHLPSDQFSKESLVTADYVEGRRGLDSLRVMAYITDHSNSTTVPHEYVWMDILDGGWLTDCFYTRLVSLSWLCILVMGTFNWRSKRWTLPHLLILIATVNATIASLFFPITNVAALFMACVGLIMLVADWHFWVPLCAVLSLAYWCSAAVDWVDYVAALWRCAGRRRSSNAEKSAAVPDQQKRSAEGTRCRRQRCQN